MVWPWLERLAYTAELQPNEQPFSAVDFPGPGYPKLSVWMKAMMALPEVPFW